MTLGFLDILRPACVVADRVDAEPDDLAIALVELGLQPRHIAEFGRADRREIFRMREQDRPAIAHPPMEIDLPLCGHGSEVWSLGAGPQRHNTFPHDSI